MEIINIKSRDAAIAWRDAVMETNEEYNRVMEDASRTIEDIKTFADGTLIDEFVSLSYNLMGAAKKIFEGMNQIYGMVSTVVDRLTDMTSTISGAIKAAGKFLGF